MQVQAHRILNSAIVTATLMLLVLSVQAGAAITTTDLFAHYDADLQTYVNAAKKNSETPIAAADGERIWEWWDQVTADGNQIVQNNNNTLQPFLRTNQLNGHNIIDMAPVGTSNTAGLLAIDNVDGTDPFGEPMDSTNQVTYTLVFKNNAPGDTTQTRYAVVFDYDDGLPGGQNFMGTRFANGERFTYTLDSAGVEQGITNDALIVGTDWIVLSVVWDGDAGTIKEYVNGQLTGTNTNAANTNTLNLGRYRLGADRGNGFSTRLDGEMAEFLIYSTALSDADRLATEQALMTKFAIPEPTSLVLLGCGTLLLARRQGAFK